jgi:hypothetical protein
MNSSQVIIIIIITKLIEVSQFLMKNLIESKVVAIRIFEVNVKSLISFMSRETKKQRENERYEKKQHERHNKILTEHEKNAVHRLIESMLIHDMSFIIDVVFSDIVTLKLAQNATSSFES